MTMIPNRQDSTQLGDDARRRRCACRPGACAELTVNAGDTIIWKNRDAFPHTATSEGKQFDSRDIAPGGSWKMVAKKRGTFAYICTLHRTMKGTLSVK